MICPALASLILGFAFQSTPHAVASARPLDKRGVAQSGPNHDAAEVAENFWKDWAAQHKYRFLRTKDERVLLMLPEERSRQERALALVEQTLVRADEICPVPARAPASGNVELGADGSNAPRTDAPPKETAQDDARRSEGAAQWGAVEHELCEEAIVVAQCRNPEDYASAVEMLGAQFSYLHGWIEKGKRDAGCVLLRPLFGACVDKVRGMQEWNADNELVHRTAQLVMLRGFGAQPVWLQLGVGWNVEFDVLNSVYCFPWRNSFVSVKEHGGWESSLKRAFERREKQPLEIGELTACKRGSFDVGEAALAWGTVRFLVRERPGSLPKLLEEMRTLREKLGRVVTEGPGGYKSWTMAADFEVPGPEQQAAIERSAGSDAFAQLTACFRLGEHGGYKGGAATR